MRYCGATSVVPPFGLAVSEQAGQVCLIAGQVSLVVQALGLLHPFASTFEQACLCLIIVLSQSAWVQVFSAPVATQVSTKTEALVPGVFGLVPLSQVWPTQVLVAQFESQTLVPATPLQVLVVQVSATVQMQILVPGITAVPLSQVSVVQVLAAQFGSQTLVPATPLQVLVVQVSATVQAQTFVPCCNNKSIPLSQVEPMQVLAAQLGSQFTVPETQAIVLLQVLVVQVLSAQ